MIALISLCLWVAILALPWRPWSTNEHLEPDHGLARGIDSLNEVTVLIPARNEGEHIETTLRAVAAQGRGLKVVVVDDESTDNTAAVLQGQAAEHVKVVHGTTPPEGWSGKLWALQQGVSHVQSEWILLIDADILLTPGMVPTLLEKVRNDRLDFVSLMASLKMESVWERLLVPAFVFFFKLLYPFKLSNNPQNRWVAAAAGGCILVRRRAVEAIGGFTSIRDALIDDCCFAQKIKGFGFRSWTGLSHGVISQRPYRTLTSFWNMVARTAFSQLRYSWLLLCGCSMLMLLSFLVPVLALVAGTSTESLCGATTLVIMLYCYLPILRYYNRPAGWMLTLPLVGLLFLGMTWTSAWRYARGERSSWKGRRYHVHVTTL